MRIAVCVQNEETRSLLSRLFQIYEEQNRCSLLLSFYNNNMELLCELIGGEYDVIFLKDSGRTGLSGDIREKDRRVRIVQIAGLSTIAQDSGDIWYCLPDPPSGAFLFPVLDRLRRDTEQDDGAGLLVKSRGAVTQLLFSHIEYVEVMGRSVFFHMSDGKTEEISGTFSDFEARLLHWPDFIKVHRAYMVNLHYVQKLESGGILTRGGHSIPVSKHLYPQLKKDYLCRLMDPDAKAEVRTTGSMPPADSSRNEYSVLLVDDEEEHRLHFSGVLTEHGCRVLTAHSGEAALLCAGQGEFDCVVLDVKLGEENGFDFCAALTGQTGAPVVFLSSLDDSGSQTQGFLSGGIDYITKDASDGLFWLKIEARIKMARAAKAELYDGWLRLDLKRRKAFLLSLEVSVTAVEFDLLCLLMQNPDTIFTPVRLYEAIWGGRQWDGGQGVQLHLSMLRRKLDGICAQHSFIETVWGKGYRFVSMPGGEAEEDTDGAL